MTTSGLSLCSKNVILALEILTSLALKKTQQTFISPYH